MRLDPNPLFRKLITPWYDSNTVCTLLLVAMVAVAVFSIIGIVVARQDTSYHGYTWVPATLLILCLFVIISVIVRLIHRSVNPSA